MSRRASHWPRKRQYSVSARATRHRQYQLQANILEMLRKAVRDSSRYPVLIRLESSSDPSFRDNVHTYSLEHMMTLAKGRAGAPTFVDTGTNPQVFRPDIPFDGLFGTLAGLNADAVGNVRQTESLEEWAGKVDAMLRELEAHR